jgi:DNA-binding NtrC family response regulator
MSDALKNTMELENSTQSKMSDGNGGGVAVQDRPAASAPSGISAVNPAPRATLRAMRDRTEIYAISQALEESGWNRKRAAKLLAISYRGLLHKIRQYNITPSLVSSLTQGPRPEM